MTSFELRRRLIARVYDAFMRGYERWAAAHRRALLGTLEGTVLEIGPGTGVNLAYLPPRVRWIGVEPNRHMHLRLRARARALGRDVDLRLGRAERLDVATSSVDAVVATLVLCSVEHPEGVLDETWRVLRPGGKLVLLEHVAAPKGSSARAWQRRLGVPWRFCTEGCHLDRDTPAIVAAAGFDASGLRELEAPRSVAPTFIAPHVVGMAAKVVGEAG